MEFDENNLEKTKSDLKRLEVSKPAHHPDQYSGLTLAYVGDAVYELYIRGMLALRGNIPAGKLHKEAVHYVNAHTQACIIEKLDASLNEKERSIVRRGKNAKPHSMSKNADPAEHAKATGFEALIGYLYLNREEERLRSLLDEAVVLADGLDLE